MMNVDDVYIIYIKIDLSWEFWRNKKYFLYLKVELFG